MIEHALAYARLGWAIFPVWPATPGGCTCPTGHPSRIEGVCKAPGKHPIPHHGLAEATADEATIRSWWDRYPDASIAVAMAKSGLLALDVDGYHGDLEKIAALESTLGLLPDTAVQLSGSGQGWHLVFRAPGFPVVGVLGGIVVRARAYIVLAPSGHTSGRRYEWVKSGAIATLPEAWLAALHREPSASSAGVPAEDQEPAWLRAIGPDARLAAATAHVAREDGEKKGIDRPGTAFNVCRSVCRGYAIRDPDAALRLILEGYNPRCSPPYPEFELARRVVGAYEDAEEPEWGALLYPDDDARRQGLAELGLGYCPHVPGAESRIAHDDLLAHVRANASRLVRSTRPEKRAEGERLARAVRGDLLQAFGDDRDAAVAATVRSLARHTPETASDAQVAGILIPSAGHLGYDLPALVVAARAEVRAEAVRRSATSWGEGGPSTDADLRAALMPGADGEGIRPSGWNIEQILRFSQGTRGRVHWNEITKSIEVEGLFADEHANTLDVAVKNWLEREWSVHASTQGVGEQLLRVARVWGKRDPVAEYLGGLHWDGVPRIDTWLETYCGTHGSDYVRRVGAMWLISAVARALEPGSKVDTVLVLEGHQGVKKSTALDILGGAWFTDTPLRLGDKDTYMLAAASWIVELGEVEFHDYDRYKQFLTSRVDKFRPPYGRAQEPSPRRCVFAGTTNRQDYLSDPTGNRRYWAVWVSRVDADRLASDRDQLWAEACARYHAGESWWFNDDEQLLADDEIASRVAENPWVSLVHDWWSRLNPEARRAGATLADIAAGALGIDRKDLRRHEHDIVATLREAALVPRGNTRARRWYDAAIAVPSAA